ncbi:sigma-70 family RNA polymerase sigma factor [Planctomycetes bacterium TBK1r]|uniref:RNA polymerase sigma factor n=1 Tax=Stieleria magnilauensis TaxID=2527963 RepID=A0ABX5XV96_9BACT|nr:hypothetical protein TBK1r_45160 [Planctomycetes bacterium TBK1r]
MLNTKDISNDRFTRGIIRRKAKQIAQRPGLDEQDVESIEQTILMHVISRMDAFDPNVAHRNVFITTVVERFVNNWLRNRVAKKRGPGYVQSLNVMVFVPGDWPTELGHTLDQSDSDKRLCINRRTDEEQSQLASDMATAIASLPKDWQRMLELRKDHSMTKVAALMGFPRTTLNGWMTQIAQRFAEAGLRDYLA